MLSPTAIGLDYTSRCCDAVLPMVTGPRPGFTTRGSSTVINVTYVVREGLRHIARMSVQTSSISSPSTACLLILRVAAKILRPTHSGREVLLQTPHEAYRRLHARRLFGPSSYLMAKKVLRSLPLVMGRV